MVEQTRIPSILEIQKLADVLKIDVHELYLSNEELVCFHSMQAIGLLIEGYTGLAIMPFERKLIGLD